MYAVVCTGGKQYRVEQGDVVRVEKLTGAVGEEVTFDDIRLVADGEALTVDKAALEGCSVRGQIVEQEKGKKIIVFKYKRRKRFRKTQGHRQAYTAVRISSINA
ncbi:MAG: 50S ribosomal protein L21 [Deltaproteobacteria bacterium]|nr:MAG: 50S ribosomal protein L21 [Deltaproteobacteria bacterium]